MTLNKRSPEMLDELLPRYAKISKADWADLYFDLYRQTCGDELASDNECIEDAENRLGILKHLPPYTQGSGKKTTEK